MLSRMKGMTEEPGTCCDCGRDLPVPRRSNKKRCDDCSHARDLKRTADWRAAHAQAAAKTHCKFGGGADVPEKYGARYRPASPCLVEFDRKYPKEKYCDSCKPVARRWQQLQAALAKYNADRKKAAKRARSNRWKRKKAAGVEIRHFGQMYPCEYWVMRGKRKARAKGCKRRYRLEGSFQKFCPNCQKLAKARVASDSRKRHLVDVKLRDHNRSKAQRDALKQLKAARNSEDAGKVIILSAPSQCGERGGAYGHKHDVQPPTNDEPPQTLRGSGIKRPPHAPSSGSFDRGRRWPIPPSIAICSFVSISCLHVKSAMRICGTRARRGLRTINRQFPRL
jgi:hypothetical protein